MKRGSCILEGEIVMKTSLILFMITKECSSFDHLITVLSFSDFPFKTFKFKMFLDKWEWTTIQGIFKNMN